jgi:hypothetical protein
MKKLIYSILSIIALIAVAYCLILFIPKANTKDIEASAHVEAVQIYAEFNSNESSANAKYNGKIIEVKGKVLKITEDKQNATVLILDAKNEFGAVLCTMQKTPKNLPKPGDIVNVKGQCNGLLMDVVLNKCHIVHD